MRQSIPGSCDVYLLSDRESPTRIFDIIPPLNYTDHINGRAYFIRSTLRPNEYWHYDGENIIVSSKHHTKFTVSIQSPDYPLENNERQVIIGKDDVMTTVKYMDVTATANPIKFALFDGGFSAGNGGELIYNLLGHGDWWELV